MILLVVTREARGSSGWQPNLSNDCTGDMVYLIPTLYMLGRSWFSMLFIHDNSNIHTHLIQ